MIKPIHLQGRIDSVPAGSALLKIQLQRLLHHGFQNTPKLPSDATTSTPVCVDGSLNSYQQEETQNHPASIIHVSDVTRTYVV